MGDDVGLRELARCAEALLQVAVEGEVDIDLLIARAVERTHRRLTGTAGRRRCAGKEHQLGLLVARATFTKHLLPRRFRAAQNLGDEARHLVVGGWFARSHLRRCRTLNIRS